MDRESECIQKTKLLLLHPIVQSIGLNAVRILSFVSLILVFSSTIADMYTNVKAVTAFDKDHNESALLNCEYIEGSSVPNQIAGAFWAYMASLLIMFQTIILSLSEVAWNSSTAFFDRYFPVLGSNFGLGILGIFQCLISTQILSHFVEDFTLVSAFFLFVIGCLNILLGLIYGESARVKRSISLSSWRALAKALPEDPPSKDIFGESTRVKRSISLNSWRGAKIRAPSPHWQAPPGQDPPTSDMSLGFVKNDSASTVFSSPDESTYYLSGANLKKTGSMTKKGFT